MSTATRGMQAILAHLSPQGADAGRVADIAVSVWLGVDAALAPLIGRGGVNALYKRSLHLTCAQYAWLTALSESSPLGDDFAALRTALAQQTSSTAAAANAAMLQTFNQLLTNLIGQSLTERLLQSVWDKPSSGDAAQDTLP